LEATANRDEKPVTYSPEMKIKFRGFIDSIRGKSPKVLPPDPPQPTTRIEAGPGTFSFMRSWARNSLDMLVRDASTPGTPDAIRQELAIVMRWLGVRGPQYIDEQHREKWAAAFVEYLAEGNPPSKALSQSFQFFKSRRSEIFPTNLLNDEIRGVMARTLASDAEISNDRS